MDEADECGPYYPCDRLGGPAQGCRFRCVPSGALFGSTLMFMVPSFMNIQNIKKRVGTALSKNNKMEIAFNYFTMVLGAGMGVLGVGISVLSQMGRL